MELDELMASRNITRYRLSKESRVPYATLSDICSGKTALSKCSAETVYRLAKALDVSMEELIEPTVEKRPAFELFKSRICHRLKELGDLDFLAEQLERDDITLYYKKKCYPESLYLLAMVDYISRINDIPLCSKYDVLRRAKLKTALYPAGVLSMAAASGNDKIKEDAAKNAIPEFMRFNIVESEIRNVV